MDLAVERSTAARFCALRDVSPIQNLLTKVDKAEAVSLED